MEQGGYQKIRQLGKDTTLLGKLENSQLLLRVFIGFENITYKQYDAKVSSLKGEALKKMCSDNLGQFLQILKQHQTLHFQASKLTLNTAEGESLVSVYFQAKTVQREMKAETIEEMIKSCADGQPEDLWNILKQLLRFVLWHTQLLEKKKKESSPLKSLGQCLLKRNQISNNQKKTKNKNMLISEEQYRKFAESSSKSRMSGGVRSSNLKTESRKDQILKTQPLSYFFDEYCLCYADVAISGGCITNINDSNIFIHRQQIEKRVFRVIFTFKQINSSVFIGIWDLKSDDRFIYLNSGIYYQCVNKCQSSPFYLKSYKIGDEVTMIVDMDKEGSIQWMVNNERVIKLSNIQLNQKETKKSEHCWVPVICLSSNGDSVEIKQ